MATNAAMLAIKAEREAQHKAEEEALRAAMMAKFAEDDRIEQLNAQRRRMKVLFTKVDQTMVLVVPLSGFWGA